MLDAAVIAANVPPATDEQESGLPVPTPVNDALFSQQFVDKDDGSRTNVLNLDFSIDDLWITDDLDELLNSTDQGFDSQPAADWDSLQFAQIFRSDSSDLPQFSGDGVFLSDRSRGNFGVLNSASPGLESHQTPAFPNVASPESDGSNQEMPENCGGDVKVLNCPSTECRGSKNYGSNVSEDTHNFTTRSGTSSQNSDCSSIRTEVVNGNITLEKLSRSNDSSSSLKRKKDFEDLVNDSVESRTMKFKKSTCNSLNNGGKINNSSNDAGLSEEDDKRKAKLIRNRESAQLSRQRKKQYVEELEDKAKTMHSIIQDLNAKISYFMVENATLRQQIGGPAAISPPPMAPPPPGMYPHPSMTYPWMPYAPPYMMRPQGSQVPLVPIPRLKPQQPAQAPKKRNNTVGKSKNKLEARKTVASISFIGLLFFILLFQGLVPMINMRYGGVRESLSDFESYVGGRVYEERHARILKVNGPASGSRRFASGENSLQYDQRGYHSGGKSSDDDSGVRMANGSEPLVASLYVPRNDKLVRIDGNLVIHSVLASEKAMSSRSEGGQMGTGTDLAVPGDFIGDPALGVGRTGSAHPLMPALGSEEADNGSHKATDGRLQQLFREGLAGPMLSSAMCTEVLQFEVSSSSPSGAIVPSTTPRNISKEQNSNSTHLSKGRRNRKILRSLPIPLPKSSHNITKQSERNSQKENFAGTNSSSPMVVSILADPREVVDVDGVMGTKSISRIFVVVLIDSVKYVTYSCILPFKGTAPHVVTA